MGPYIYVSSNVKNYICLTLGCGNTCMRRMSKLASFFLRRIISKSEWHENGNMVIVIGEHNGWHNFWHLM